MDLFMFKEGNLNIKPIYMQDLREILLNMEFILYLNDCR